MKPNPVVISVLSKLSGVIPTWKIIPGQDIIETAFKQPEVRKQVFSPLFSGNNIESYTYMCNDIVKWLKVRENPYCYKGRPRLKTANELLRISTDLEKRLDEVFLYNFRWWEC